MKLAGKVAIVTGGATGIGRGITASLAQAGARVVIAQRRKELAEQLVQELSASDEFEGVAVSVDVRRREQVQSLVQATISSFGRLDILINNAALTGPDVISPFLECSDELLTDVLDVNLKGAFICAQEAARQMTSAGGSIINVSSVGAFAAQEGASIYCATKAGLVGLTQAMAMDLAQFNIRVNCIAPGFIKTSDQNVHNEMRQRGISGRYLRNIPLNRPGRPEEIGSAVVFLASEDAAYITGETLVIDGGFLIY